MNLEGESPSAIMTAIQGRTIAICLEQQNATKCIPTASNSLSVVRNHSARNCTAIVPYSSHDPPRRSSLLDAPPHVLKKAKSLLAALSNCMNTSRSAKRRHSPYERSICCLCRHTEDNSNVTAIYTLEELKAFAHNDVADMLRPIWNGLSTLRSDLERENACVQQPVALQMISGDVRLPEDGTFISPGSSCVLTGDSHFPPDGTFISPGSSSVLTGDWHFPPDATFISPGSSSVLTGESHLTPAEHEHSPRSSWMEYTQSYQMRRKLPTLVEEFTATGTEAQSDAGLSQQRDWYNEKLKEKNNEIEALQATVYDLVGYQQKINVELEKVKRHIFNEAAEGVSPSSFPDGRPTLYFDLLDSTFKAADAALDSFTTYFIAYSETRAHGPADKIWKPNFRSMYLAKESHWTYAMKAFFCERMFVGFENESFMTDSASLYLDLVKLRKESYEYFKCVNAVGSSSPCISFSKDAHFRTFCKQKFDSIVPDAFLLQPGDYDENVIENSIATLAEINLSKSFMVAAMKVWTLHKLCFAFEPAANIFRARRGLNVDWKYMESVVRLEDDDMFISKVGFMIAPGFRLRESTVKSRIYPAGRRTASKVGIHRHLQAT